LREAIGRERPEQPRGGDVTAVFGTMYETAHGVTEVETRTNLIDTGERSAARERAPRQVVSAASADLHAAARGAAQPAGASPKAPIPHVLPASF